MSSRILELQRTAINKQYGIAFNKMANKIQKELQWKTPKMPFLQTGQCKMGALYGMQKYANGNS